MPPFVPTVSLSSSPVPLAVMRELDDWGIRSLDLLYPPSRFWSDSNPIRAVVEPAVDALRTVPCATPAQLFGQIPASENWLPINRRSLARLLAWFLLAEDPQRRLDARPVNTLAHQMSLVRHILDSPNLNRVMIADEVGLGKTVEAGLIIQELLSRQPDLKVLYLAPARLVSNVRAEFDRMGLFFRKWTAGESDATLSDPRILASIHRAVHARHLEKVINSGPWDVLVVDECHHLSDWAEGGGDPKEKFRLVRELIARQPPESRVILMSGTPHQGHRHRFNNLIGLLQAPNEKAADIGGRVIYRTKEDVTDWEGRPLFPRREVHPPLVIDLGPAYRHWLASIYAYFRPPQDITSESRKRAVGWRIAQAMQWAASSPQAGLGYLVRHAIRSGWDLSIPTLGQAIAAIRPYRGGPINEPVEAIFQRLLREIRPMTEAEEVEDIESEENSVEVQDRAALLVLLDEGISVVRSCSDEKWAVLDREILQKANGEKIVLFAQPVETVMAVAGWLERSIGERPALIIGGQSDEERTRMVQQFRSRKGPRYLVSSKAGGEGINLQVARRLVHLDVPWNPMDMEQRVGRVHRFGSTRTILVDTLVVRDSREAAAYAAAREKLRLIVGTLVEPERFEIIFSRVIGLISPDELSGIIANDVRIPLAPEERDQISQLIQDGFNSWKSFQDQCGLEQERIRRIAPGSARWEDVYRLLKQYAKAEPATGFSALRFTLQGDEVAHTPEAATVVRLSDGRVLSCGDYSGSPVSDQNDVPAESAGLNKAPISELLRELAFPRNGVTGPAYLRWPAGVSLPGSGIGFPFGILVLIRQSARQEALAGWLEQGLSLHCYQVGGNSAPAELLEPEKGAILRGLQDATLTAKAPNTPELIESMLQAETSLIEKLRRPTNEEHANRIRFAVWPLLAAVIAEPG